MISDSKEVSCRDLANLLGISVRRVQQLTQIGILRKSENNKYALSVSIKNYSKSLKRLLHRYMALYQMLCKAKGITTRYENLPFYEDLQGISLSEEDLAKMRITGKEIKKAFRP